MTDDHYKPTKAQIAVLKELAAAPEGWLPTTTSTIAGKYVAGTAAEALARRGFVAGHCIPTVFNTDGTVLMVDRIGVKLTDAGRELHKRVTFKITPADSAAIERHIAESPFGSDPLCAGCADPVVDGESNITRVADGVDIVWHVDCAPEEMRITKSTHGGGMAGHDDA